MAEDSPMASNKHQAAEWASLNHHFDTEPDENIGDIQLSTFKTTTAGTVLESQRTDIHNSVPNNYVPDRVASDFAFRQEQSPESGWRILVGLFSKRQRKKSQVKWYRRRGILRFPRAVFVGVKIYLTMQNILGEASFVINLIWTLVLVLWDIVHFIDSSCNAFQLGFEIKTIFECTSAVVIFIALCIDIEGARNLKENPYFYLVPLEELNAIAACSVLITFFVLGITARFSYRHVKDYPTNRRLYNKSKPIIVFAPNGDAIAMLTDSPPVLETAMARYSIDSLLQHSENSREGAILNEPHLSYR